MIFTQVEQLIQVQGLSSVCGEVNAYVFTAPEEDLPSKEENQALYKALNNPMVFGFVQADIERFLLAVKKHEGQSDRSWLARSQFPFLQVFEDEHVQEFIDEVLPLFEAARSKNDLEPFFGNIRAWVSTAEAYHDKSLHS